MDWSNERYVRVYTRDTTSWLVLTWEARALLLMMIRKADRSGVIDVGEDGTDGLAVVVGMPPEVVETAVAQLLKRGTVTQTEVSYILPNFLEAQEAKATDRQRQKELRERRRVDVTRGHTASHDVTPRHAVSHGVTDGHAVSHEEGEPSRGVTKPSLAVTRRHAVSHGVTPSLAKPFLGDTDATGPTGGSVVRASPELPDLRSGSPGRSTGSGWSDQPEMHQDEPGGARRGDPAPARGVDPEVAATGKLDPVSAVSATVLVDKDLRMVAVGLWQYAAGQHTAVRSEVEPICIPWPANPSGEPWRDLQARVRELAEGQEQRDIAALEVAGRRRVDVAMAEARRDRSMKFTSPSAMWSSRSFAVAVGMTPEQASKPRRKAAQAAGTNFDDAVDAALADLKRGGGA
jgi:hypothetical protein